MKTLSISEARNRLPVLVEDVARTREPVTVSRYGVPLAMIVPVTPAQNSKARYPLRGRCVTVAGDFDAPMPEEWDALATAEAVATCGAKRRKAKRSARS
jgi:prevent-host-death family protein